MDIISKFLTKVFLFLLFILCVLLCLLSAAEYMPAPVETVELSRAPGGSAVPASQDLEFLTWNIGSGIRGMSEDLFMEGGSRTKPEGKDSVRTSLDVIRSVIAEQQADFVLLQEVSSNSSSSYGIDEREVLNQEVSTWAYALNHSCNFIPYPWPPVGRVHAGLLTASGLYPAASAQRFSLPCSFSWPIRTIAPKPCLLVLRFPVENSSRQLVLANLQFETYGQDNLNASQMAHLLQFMQDEYAKGNYVIAGGDFSLTMPGSSNYYPNTHASQWEPGVFDTSLLPANWTLAYDLSIPGRRLLNQAYNPSDQSGTQYFVTDALLLSPNVMLRSIETVHCGFSHAAHNPLKLTASLTPDALYQ